jgi:8-oxo-dGTP diphosphatase
MEHKVFGAPQSGVAYRDRSGAYGIAFDGAGKAAVVSCERKGCFLLGGGIEPGESEAECIRREALEETGYAVTIGEKVCIGEEYITDLKGRPCHPTGHVYLIELGEKAAPPVESDHILTWMPIEEFKSATFMRYQAWAMEMAWELYQKRQKEKKS